MEAKTVVVELNGDEVKAIIAMANIAGIVANFPLEMEPAIMRLPPREQFNLTVSAIALLNDCPDGAVSLCTKIEAIDLKAIDAQDLKEETLQVIRDGITNNQCDCPVPSVDRMFG